MKVLYVASGTLMSGGATKSFIAMLREADKAGIEYRVVCPDDKGLTEYLREKGVETYVLPYRHNRLPSSDTFINKLKWLPRLLHDGYINKNANRKLPAVVKDFMPDIVHENSSAVSVGYHLAKKIGVPYVMHIREYGDLDFNVRFLEVKKRLADKECWTISITNDLYHNKRQDQNPRGVQIYNGILRADQLRYTSDKKKYFLYAGRIEAAKGVAEMVDAYLDYAKSVSDPMPIKLAGWEKYPDYAEKIREKVSEAGLERYVEWLGERKDIADLAFEATATIIPSKFEALGRVMPEAMANGSLCVGRNTGGTKEQMDNGRKFTGANIAIRYDTSDELTAILKDIHDRTKEENPFVEGGEYKEIIDRSQKSVMEFFSEEQFGRKLIDFYEKIIQARK